MRVIIVPDDGMVIVGGKGFKVDCSSVAATIHAVQWNDDHGVVEYKTGAPVSITDISPYQAVIDLWNVENNRPPPTPPPLVITQITRRQLILMLLQLTYITAAEAIAAASSGAIPALISGYLATLSDADRTVATVTWASMSICLRSDPMLAALATGKGLTSAQLDAFFVTASRL